MALAKNTHMSYVMTKKANFEVTSMQVSEERDDRDDLIRELWLKITENNELIQNIKEKLMKITSDNIEL